jgi:hypothetical protein
MDMVLIRLIWERGWDDAMVVVDRNLPANKEAAWREFRDKCIYMKEETID